MIIFLFYFTNVLKTIRVLRPVKIFNEFEKILVSKAI